MPQYPSLAPRVRLWALHASHALSSTSFLQFRFHLARSHSYLSTASRALAPVDNEPTLGRCTERSTGEHIVDRGTFHPGNLLEASVPLDAFLPERASSPRLPHRVLCATAPERPRAQGTGPGPRNLCATLGRGAFRSFCDLPPCVRAWRAVDTERRSCLKDVHSLRCSYLRQPRLLSRHLNGVEPMQIDGVLSILLNVLVSNTR